MEATLHIKNNVGFHYKYNHGKPVRFREEGFSQNNSVCERQHVEERDEKRKKGALKMQS